MRDLETGPQPAKLSFLALSDSLCGLSFRSKLRLILQIYLESHKLDIGQRAAERARRESLKAQLIAQPISNQKRF